MAVALNHATRRVLDAKPFAMVATLNPDGGPQTSIVWLKRDGDAVLFTTTRQRRKGKNLARDPRISILVGDPGDPYRFVEIRGRAELTDDPGNTLGNELSQRYLGEPAPDEPATIERVIVRVSADKLTGPLASA